MRRDNQAKLAVCTQFSSNLTIVAGEFVCSIDASDLFRNCVHRARCPSQPTDDERMRLAVETDRVN
jgi:hypothetical protein